MLKTTKISLITLLALTSVLNLAGCGQTGPLYLPQKLGQSPAAPTATPAPSAIIAALRVS